MLSSFGVGGQERVALDVAIGQKRLGHRVSVISLAAGEHGPLVEEFRAAELAVAQVGKTAAGLDPTLTFRLARWFRHHGVQIVHTHNPQPLIYGAPAARLAGAIAIHTKHGKNPGTVAQRALRRAAASCTHAFVAVSATTAEQARTHHECASAKLQMIANGIRLERYSPNAELRASARRELGVGDAFVVGTVGRLDTYKNQRLLISAMAPLLTAQTRLVIVGDGPTRAALEAQVAALPDPQWVTLTGRRMDVPALMPAFDVFALSSTTEGLPLVIPEAMAAGLPVVATAVGGIPSVIADDVTGYLVPSENEAALRTAIVGLRDAPLRRRTMGEAARVAALRDFSAERMVNDYMRLYERFL